MTPDPHADLRAVLDDVLPLRARALVRALLAERDKLDKHVSETQDDGEWLDEVDAALGEDRKKAPFIDDAVRLLRKERDALKAEVEKLRAAKPTEDAKAPSVIRDGFPPDSLLEEAARLGRELADSLDDLWREGRRRMWSD